MMNLKVWVLVVVGLVLFVQSSEAINLRDQVIGSLDKKKRAKKGRGLSGEEKRCSTFFPPKSSEACECNEVCVIKGDPHVFPFESNCGSIVEMIPNHVHLLYEMPNVMKVQGLVLQRGSLAHVRAVYYNQFKSNPDFDKVTPLMSTETCNHGDVITRKEITPNPADPSSDLELELELECLLRGKPPQVLVKITIKNVVLGSGTPLDSSFSAAKRWTENYKNTSSGIGSRSAAFNNDFGHCVMGSTFPDPIPHGGPLDPKVAAKYNSKGSNVALPTADDARYCRKTVGPPGRQCTCKSNCHMFGDPHTGFFDRKCNDNLSCEFDTKPQGSKPSILIYETLTGTQKQRNRRGVRIYGFVDDLNRLVDLRFFYYMEGIGPEVFKRKVDVSACGARDTDTSFFEPRKIEQGACDGPKKPDDCYLFHDDFNGFRLGEVPIVTSGNSLVQDFEEMETNQDKRRKKGKNNNQASTMLDLGGMQALIKCDYSRGASFLNLCLDRTALQFVEQSIRNAQGEIIASTFGGLERDVVYSQGACTIASTDKKDDYVPRRREFADAPGGQFLDQVFGETWPLDNQS